MKLIRLPALWLLTLLPLLLLLSCSQDPVSPTVNVNSTTQDLKIRWVEVSTSERFSDTITVSNEQCKKVQDLHLILTETGGIVYFKEYGNKHTRRAVAPTVKYIM
jgi:hypothetical protein